MDKRLGLGSGILYIIFALVLELIGELIWLLLYMLYFMTSLTVIASCVLNQIQGNTYLAKLNEIMTSYLSLFLS